MATTRITVVLKQIMAAFISNISISKTTELIRWLVKATMLTMDQGLGINMPTATGLWELSKVVTWDITMCQSLYQAALAVDPSLRN